MAVSKSLETRVFCPAILGAYRTLCDDVDAVVAHPTGDGEPHPDPPEKKKKRKSKKRSLVEESASSTAPREAQAGPDVKQVVAVQNLVAIAEAHFREITKTSAGASVQAIESLFLEVTRLNLA